MRASKTRSLAKKKADKYFSEYIRERDSNKGVCTCVTCGKRTTEFDCGHFISRRFDTTRFDEKNAHGQCLKCNRFENGNQFQHGIRIDEIHGKGTAEGLLVKSKMVSKRKQSDYERIAKEYKSKTENLKRLK